MSEDKSETEQELWRLRCARTMLVGAENHLRVLAKESADNRPLGCDLNATADGILSLIQQINTDLAWKHRIDIDEAVSADDIAEAISGHGKNKSEARKAARSYLAQAAQAASDALHGDEPYCPAGTPPGFVGLLKRGKEAAAHLADDKSGLMGGKPLGR